MKTLAITFAFALAIISLAIYKGSVNSSATVNYDNGRTIITYDAMGRVVSELSMITDGKKWKETTLRQTKYNGQFAETTTYVKRNTAHGEAWIAASRQVCEIACGKSAYVVRYESLKDDKWAVEAERASNDLAAESDIVDDLVFDDKGNLVMKATYKWDEDGKKGLQMEEYQYDNNEYMRLVSYAWSNDGWEKKAVSNIIVKGNN